MKLNSKTNTTSNNWETQDQSTQFKPKNFQESSEI